MEEKKLSEFLKENGAYGSFVENCVETFLEDIKVYYTMKSDNEIIGINNGFIWQNTKQGSKYWKDLYYNQPKDLIYDMNGIIFAEVDKRIAEQNPITKGVVEENSTDDIEQEFQTITLNGVDYHLIPKEVSVGYIKGWYDKAMKVEATEKSPLLTLNDLRDIGLSDEDLIANGYSEEDLRKEPREKHLKRKFEESTGKYEVLFKEKKSNDWSFCYRPNDLSWRKDWDYILIKKEHKELIEAFLKDTTLKVHYRWHDEDWMLLEDFIENYDEDMQLRIAKKEFKPFALNIDVNTIDEAKSLWNILCINYNVLCKAMQGDYYNIEFKDRLDTYEYWNQIDEVLIELGEEPDVI